MNRNADIFDAGNIIKSRGEFDLASCFPRYEDRQSKVAYEYRNLRIFVSSCKCIGLFLRGRARKTSLFSNAGCLTVDLQKQEELKEALCLCERYGVSRINNKEIYLFPDGKAWSYRENEVTDRKGKAYTEAIFLDITKKYEEKINLTKQTEQLKEIAKELRYLSDNVLILTREREVLAAKTKLHDQMGAGLTAIRQSLTQENADDKEAVRLFRHAVNAIWNDNQYPLEEGDFERFLQDAKTLGVEVVCVGDLSESEELASICILAMRECLTNGVCHAGATELSIKMQNENHQYSICITNNGAAPDKEIVPKGGLYNISRHVFDYGGEMRIQSFPYFALTITFQEERA